MKILPDIGAAVPEVWLPKPRTDLKKWSVIACDQYTSQPEYWREVEELVGQAPSTLNLTFPEIYLESPGKEERIQNIQSTMRRYLDDGLLEPHQGIVYVERRVSGRRRKGIILCLDLERYDYSQGSKSLIRATEGTIVDRLPPRMKIREGATLELPHILVLIDDPERTVIEPIAAGKPALEPLYDFDLMFDSGHLTGFLLSQQWEVQVTAALAALAAPQAFGRKYGMGNEAAVLLFAMGDGNHSLATAKAVWEKMKPRVGMAHPARYALVEIENVHDEGLVFEPIHRVLFDVQSDLLEALRSRFGAAMRYSSTSSADEMAMRVDTQAGAEHSIGIVQGAQPAKFGVIEIAKPSSSLPVGTLQAFLDSYLKEGGAKKVDYLHGAEVLVQLGSQNGNAGFYLPRMGKASLFKTVILDGALPRKTFSMGEAREKRFYMEARKIV